MLATLALTVALTSADGPYHRRTPPAPGVACIKNGVKSFAFDDAGRPGVPTLTRAQITTLQRVFRARPSKTLRFALVPTPNSRIVTFVVFDAGFGPCPNTPGYGILNDACNAVFSPDSPPYYTKNVPSCIDHKSPL
jgi:hypothetical protein